MQTTSLEVSKKLYKLSGWHATPYYHCIFRNESSPKESWDMVHTTLETISDAVDMSERPYLKDFKRYPAYDLGYLLRKLPAKVYLKTDAGKLQKYPNYLSIQPQPNGKCRAIYLKSGSRNYLWVEAETPEDAAGLLSIKLFEEGVLK